MASSPDGTPQMKGTLGLTGLTMNAMALIAPGAFLWLTFAQQCQYGAPMAGSDIWFGILAALALCFATAISYAELSKLFPGAGSSYFFAEQAFLAKTHAFKFARVAKFIIGWSSHLYYWVYPGVMVGVTAILVGYLAGQFFPITFSSAIGSPPLMIGFCVLFAFGVAYIAYRGITTSTTVNIAVNIIQISALLIFSVIAIGYRVGHGEGTRGWTLDPDSTPINVVLAQDKDGKPFKDAEGNWVVEKDEKGEPKPLLLEGYDKPITDEKDPNNADATLPTRQLFANAADVVKPHGFSYIFIQAGIAILILVGFESVTAMGEEAKNARRDVPRAVLLSLFIQGVVCYGIEYFAAGYFLNPGYPMTTAKGSSAPVGDMAVIAGTALFNGNVTAGWWFMIVLAVTVFLALVGTTLASINTGARVTYAMGRDQEVPEHFGMLHEKNLSPHRAIWALAIISAVFGVLALTMLFGDAGALPDATIQALPHGFWSSFGYVSHDTMAKFPNSLLTITLASNFGTFLLYMLSCVTCIFCYKGHPNYSFVRHTLIPYFGIAANLICMGAYIVLPFMGYGTKMEPFLALGIAAVWAIYGGIYFLRSSKATGRTTLVTSRT
ncbi:MAG TPA: APC family permease [Gemmataceae bacterium]|nr:APC family permease [Gemmataceae bacterium]